MAEVELEPARESTTSTTATTAKVLEELRKLRAATGERLPALLRRRVVRILAIVETRTEL